jgi:hypothetical protein
MKRGPKSLLTPKLQKRICDILADANTIQTACDACGISERVYFDWCQKHPAFYAATREARARAKIKLVKIIHNAAKINARHAEFLLERSWPNEYARTERIEQIGEQADDKKIALNVYYNNDQSIEKLLNFPIHSSMGTGPRFAKGGSGKAAPTRSDDGKSASARNT